MIKLKQNINSSQWRWNKLLELFFKVLERCMLKKSCIEILSHKILSSELRIHRNVLLLILDWLSLLMLMSIFLLDVVHLAMLLLRLLISRIWRLSMNLFVTSFLLGLFSIFFFWEWVPSLGRLIIRFLLKIELVISVLKENSTKN